MPRAAEEECESSSVASVVSILIANHKDLTQRMMLATWLVEIYLSKINQLEDIAASEAASDDAENYIAEKAIIEDDLKQFLQEHKDNLDKQTIFGLIASHGRSEILLHFAAVVEDYARIVAHWLREEDWHAALLALARQVRRDLCRDSFCAALNPSHSE